MAQGDSFYSVGYPLRMDARLANRQRLGISDITLHSA
jgi:hypothetical protein